jgi:hypothetical protein
MIILSCILVARLEQIVRVFCDLFTERHFYYILTKGVHMYTVSFLSPDKLIPLYINRGARWCS